MVVLRANGCTVCLAAPTFNVDCYLIEYVEHFEAGVSIFDSLQLRGQTIAPELLDVPQSGVSRPSRGNVLNIYLVVALT